MWLSKSVRPFLYSSVYSCHFFLISSASVRSLLFLSLIIPIPEQDVSLISPVFLKRCLVFPTLLFSSFLCVVHWRRPFYLSLLFSGTVHSVVYIFPFLPCFSLLFFPQLFVKPSQTTTLPSWISFFFGMVLVTNSCTMLWTSIHNSSGILSTRSNPSNLLITSTI